MGVQVKKPWRADEEERERLERGVADVALARDHAGEVRAVEAGARPAPAASAAAAGPDASAASGPRRGQAAAREVEHGQDQEHGVLRADRDQQPAAEPGGQPPPARRARKRVLSRAQPGQHEQRWPRPPTRRATSTGWPPCRRRAAWPARRRSRPARPWPLRSAGAGRPPGAGARPRSRRKWRWSRWPGRPAPKPSAGGAPSHRTGPPPRRASRGRAAARRARCRWACGWWACPRRS